MKEKVSKLTYPHTPLLANATQRQAEFPLYTRMTINYSGKFKVLKVKLFWCVIMQIIK